MTYIFKIYIQLFLEIANTINALAAVFSSDKIVRLQF